MTTLTYPVACDRIHCHRTLGLSAYLVTHVVEGVRVTDRRHYCGEHREGTPEMISVYCPMRGGEAATADQVTGRCQVCGQRNHEAVRS